MASSCVACDKVGIVLLGPGKTQQKKPSLVKKLKAVLHLGNNEFSQTFEEASETMLKRHFHKIASLRDISESDFKHGMIGKCKIPNTTLSEIPNIAEPNSLKKVVSKKGLPESFIDGMDHVNRLVPITLQLNLDFIVLLN